MRLKIEFFNFWCVEMSGKLLKLPALKEKMVCVFLVSFLACTVTYASYGPDARTEVAEGAILFRFVPGRLMFYYDYRENSQAIRKADSLIAANLGRISSGEAVVKIRGYCTSWDSDARNRASARNRSNQVKSWYIVHSGMKEEWFRTENSIRPDTVYTGGCGDLVALLYVESLEKDTGTPGTRAAGRDSGMRIGKDPLPRLEDMPQGRICHEIPAGTILSATRRQPASEGEGKADTAGTAADAASGGKEGRHAGQPAEARNLRSRNPLKFNIKTNLLYDAAGFPSLEVEIPFGYKWSLNLEGAVAWWSSYKKDNFYQLDLLSPEVRRWFGQKSRWHGHYIGAFGMLGLYDLEWKGGRGYQGEYWAAGFSYGYMFPVARKLSLEAGIGLGFLQTGYEEYLPQDGHYVYQQSSRTSYWGPVKLKLGLVWRIGDTPAEKRRAGL